MPTPMHEDALERVEKILSRRFADVWYAGIRGRVLWLAKCVLNGGEQIEVLDELRGYLSDDEMKAVEDVKKVLAEALTAPSEET